MRKFFQVMALSVFAMVASGVPIGLFDNFSAPAAGQNIVVAGSVTQANVFGNFDREATLSNIIGVAALNINTPIVSPLSMSLSNDVNSFSTGTVKYTLDAAPFDASSMYNGYLFSLNMIYHDLAGSTLEFFIEDSTGKIVSNTFGPPLAIASAVSPITYTAFMDANSVAGFNLASVANFGFRVNTNTGRVPVSSQDLTFDLFSVKEVPEPGTYALMGLGLAGLAFLRRRK